MAVRSVRMSTFHRRSSLVLLVLFFLNTVSSEAVQGTSLCDICQCTEDEVTCNSLRDPDMLLTYEGNDVIQLTITKSDLGTSRKEHFSRFQNVSIVTINSSKLRVDSSTFSLLTKILMFNLENNSIDAIASGMFGNSTNLLYLSLNENGITQLRNDSFKNLQHLTNLLLANNSIAEIDAGTFANLTSLEELDLSGNRLLRMEASMLAPLRSLRVLRLERNLLASFSPALVDLLAQRPGLSAHLEHNPLRCECGELRAAWAAATARALSLSLTCASGQAWEDVMRSLSCTDGENSIETSIQSGDDNAVIVAERDEGLQMNDGNAISSVENISNSTMQETDEHAVAKEQSNEDDNDLDPAVVVAAAEGVLIADTILQVAAGDDEALSEETDGKQLGPAQTVALAEGLLIADAIWQVANGGDSGSSGGGGTEPGDLSPAQVVAVAEGIAIAEAIVEAANEMDPSANAIWRATLEADSSFKHKEVSEESDGEESLNKALITLLGIVMLVLSITGSASAMVLYHRLRSSGEADDEQSHFYSLVNISDSQSTARESSQSSRDVYGVSYTFPDVENGRVT